MIYSIPSLFLFCPAPSSLLGREEFKEVEEEKGGQKEEEMERE